MRSVIALLIIVLLMAIPACGSLGDDDEQPAAFGLEVVPAEVADAAPGQRVVLLVTVEDAGTGPGAGDAVKLDVTAPGAETIIEPEDRLMPGVVGEVTIIPGQDLVLREEAGIAVALALQPEPVATIDVEIVAERQGLRQTLNVPVGVVPSDEPPLAAAEDARDVFIPWLAENHPELGITAETEWVATPTKPHWLVVSHYLFYSDRWEMGVRWHIMIEPHNWAEIYLRERFVEVEPGLGFKVDSVTVDPEAIYQIEVVEPVWR